MSKRLLLAQSMNNLGILRLLEGFRSKPGILILNYHRIGERSESVFDRELFSATADDFDRQLKYLKQHFEILSGDALQSLVRSKDCIKRMHVALTFDDGYLDNYTQAFPILRANDCTATFFLIAQYVGSALIPWWDEIAFLIRNTKKQHLRLEFPVPITIPLEGDREGAIRAALRHYKRPDNVHCDDLMDQLRREANCPLPDVHRRFLNWSEAREMRDAGMTIGSHTQTHPILGQITPARQEWELRQSKQIIEENLGSKIDTLAYPVGTRNGFDAATENLARSLGYSMCFSFYGGVNTPHNMKATNLLRGNTSTEPELFRAETMMRAKLGSLFH